MYRTNSIARKWLKDNDYENLFLFGHSRWSKDLHLEGQEFDGLATHNNKIVLLQIKTNCKATKKTLLKYAELEKRFGIKLLWINYINRHGLQINNNDA